MQSESSMEPEPQPHAEADISGRDSDVSSESGAAYVAAERHKVEGTEAFKNGEFSRAAEHYEAALSLAAQCTDNADVKALVLALRLNCAAARLKTADPADALPHCEAALVLDPCSSKALYRKGQALVELGEPALARAALMEAYKLAPRDKQVIALLRKADTAAKEAKAEKRRHLLRAVVSDPLPVSRLMYLHSCTRSFALTTTDHHRESHPLAKVRIPRVALRNLR
jgi:tetratricopeptide (TPR) repeat protein